MGFNENGTKLDYLNNILVTTSFCSNQISPLVADYQILTVSGGHFTVVWLIDDKQILDTLAGRTQSLKCGHVPAKPEFDRLVLMRKICFLIPSIGLDYRVRASLFLSAQSHGVLLQLIFVIDDEMRITRE